MTDERNILDALVESMVKPKELRALLVKKAQLMRLEQMKNLSSETFAKIRIRNSLLEWLSEHHYPITGRKKLLDKVMSEAMRDYRSQLRSSLYQEAREAERSAKSYSDTSIINVMYRAQARDVKSRIASGRGKRRWR